MAKSLDFFWISLQAAEAENAPGEGPFREAKFFFGFRVESAGVQGFRGSGVPRVSGVQIFRDLEVEGFRGSGV